MLHFSIDNFFLPLLTIATLHLLAVISPGPDFALTVKIAISQPRKIAIYTALGIALGLSIHITYCILGLALLIKNSILLLNAFQYVCAAYFIYIGTQGLRAKAPIDKTFNDAERVDLISISTALKRGFLCNALNPKATMFFLGLFTLVVKPNTPVLFEIIYGIEMMLVTFLWFALLAIIITHANIKPKIVRFQHYIIKSMSVLLIAFGLKLACLEYK